MQDSSQNNLLRSGPAPLVTGRVIVTRNRVGLLHVLAPLLVMAHNGNLSERLLIAHGMALKETAA
jgi:hypothetical protein